MTAIALFCLRLAPGLPSAPDLTRRAIGAASQLQEYLQQLSLPETRPHGFRTARILGWFLAFVISVAR